MTDDRRKKLWRASHGLNFPQMSVINPTYYLILQALFLCKEAVLAEYTVVLCSKQIQIWISAEYVKPDMNFPEI